MKKSFMSNIMNFVDSNVRQRIDRVAHNNNEFFSDDLLILERHFEDIRQVCIEAEKRISATLQSIQSTPSLGAYTQNVQVGLNNLSHNIAHVAAGSSSSSATQHQPQVPPLQPTTTGAGGGGGGLGGGNLKSQQQATNATANSKSSNNLVTAKAEFSSSKPKPYTTYSEQATRASQSSRSTNHDDGSNINNGSHLVSNSPTDIIDPTQQLTNDILHNRHKKLPIVGLLKFLAKSCHKLKPDSLLATTVTHCSQLQLQLTRLYLAYEQTIELQCLRPVQHMLELDIPNVVKLRKLFIKSHNDLESLKAKYNGASQKQQQLIQQQQQQQQQQNANSYTIAQTSAQQSNINKLDLLKKELDDGVTRFEQARDNYEAELYSFVCRESELVDLLRSLYKYQADYHQQVVDTIRGSLPALDNTLVHTPRKVVFGTQLDEHLRCTGQLVSPVIELCTHLLYSHGLKEEGLFRIPGSSMKIKKLKNAINAWFVTLASRQELESDQQRQTGHSNIVALYDLFKNILAHNGRSICLDVVLNSQATNDDSTLTKNNVSNVTPPAEDDNYQLTFDLHSIAGLLKLYLRELPEPLISHSLYDQWVEAVSVNTNEDKVDALRRVIEQMPKSNYDNLRHLIRFLHLLTCHQDLNKMSSSNLAITMAPSLIWSKCCMGGPTNKQQLTSTEATSSSSQSLHGASCDGPSVDDANSMNLQMSSIGMSASLHALVLEGLINHAEGLFPGLVDFTLPGFKERRLNSGSNDQQGHQRLSASSLLSKNRDRSVKSTSPTGISTASSSSFSSNASTSTTSSAKTKTHSRKSGSMDGLLNHSQAPTATMTSSSSGTTTNTEPKTGTCITKNCSMGSSRPASVHLQAKEFSSSTTNRNLHQPPPVPPVPLSRSHVRQVSSDYQPPLTCSGYNLKPPAPPVPQQQSLISSGFGQRHEDNDDKPTVDQQKPRAASLRGTGTITSTAGGCPSSLTTNSGSTNLNSIRPTVPPPDRPHLGASQRIHEPSERPEPSSRPPTCDGDGDNNMRPTSSSSQKDVTSTSIRRAGDNRSVCPTLRDDCGPISGANMEEIHIIGADTPVVWPDSNSGDDDGDGKSCGGNDHDHDHDDDHDDSSFDDNDDHHQPHHSSWERCASTTSGLSSSRVTTSSDVTTTTTTANRCQTLADQATPRSTSSSATSSHEVSKKPPVKPPRSISPKITQSTPL